MTLTQEMHKQQAPSKEVVHNMCLYVRKIAAFFDEDPTTRDHWTGPCRGCDGWKKEEGGKSAKACYIRAEECLKYAMVILKRDGWSEPNQG